MPSVMLTSRTLKRFKAAFEPGPIDFSPFNVLIGRNGSGKSTVIEALQWIEQSLRDSPNKACDRYFGVRDICNLRTASSEPYFAIRVSARGREASVQYHMRITSSAGSGALRIDQEEFVVRPTGGGEDSTLLDEADAPDLLALARSAHPDVHEFQDFWRHAVFLRLSPSTLAQGGPPRRRSSDPG